MPKPNRYDQLDAVVQAVLERKSAPKVEARLAGIVRVAEVLRDLPRAEFKMRLKQELKMKTAIVEEPKKVKPIPEGYHTITPYIVVEKAAELIEFVKQAFGGVEKFRGTGGAGGIHCEMQVGDSMMMIGGGGKYRGEYNPTAIHLYVEDADLVYERALAAGATSLRPPQDQFYGDRDATVKDAFGNNWYIGTNKETGQAPEGMRTVNVSLHPQKAAPMIDFLQRAFGAEELQRAEAPDGRIHYAKMKIGDSVLDMGEAHGEFQPMPTMFYLYVDDVDAWYKRAVEAGAESMSPPTNQDYGDRSAGLKDPFGNQWYIATHIKDVSA